MARADHKAASANLRDHEQLRVGGQVSMLRNAQGIQGLQVDPAIHDAVPTLDEIMPPPAKGEEKAGEGKKEESAGGSNYTIGEYKPMY